MILELEKPHQANEKDFKIEEAKNYHSNSFEEPKDSKKEEQEQRKNSLESMPDLKWITALNEKIQRLLHLRRSKLLETTVEEYKNSLI